MTLFGNRRRADVHSSSSGAIGHAVMRQPQVSISHARRVQPKPVDKRETKMSRYLDLMVAEVQYEHGLRVDDPDSIPRPRRSFRHRARPNTALIAQACAAKAAEGERHCWEDNCHECSPP